MSQADGNLAQSELDAPIYITTRQVDELSCGCGYLPTLRDRTRGNASAARHRAAHEPAALTPWRVGPGRPGASQDVTVRHVTVASNLNFKSPMPTTPLVYIGVAVARSEPEGEWYRGHVKLETLTLFGTAGDAIKVVGTGLVDITNLHAGGTGDQSFYGGPATIGGRCVNVAGPDADVVLRDGFCRSNLTAAPGAPREAAVWNVSRVDSVRGVSPVGVLPTPFAPATPTARPTVGLGGTAAEPRTGECYTVRGVPVLLSVTGGAGVRVDLADADGTVVFGPLPALTPTTVPVGWAVCFEFDAAPTVRVGGS